MVFVVLFSPLAFSSVLCNLLTRKKNCFVAGSSLSYNSILYMIMYLLKGKLCDSCP